MTETASPLSEELLTRISAYVDGELTEEDAAALEAEAAENPDIMAEIDATLQIDGLLTGAFNEMLDEDGMREVPDVLRLDKMPEPANLPGRPLMSFGNLAAAALLLAIGAGLGVYGGREFGPPVEVAQARGWMADVADYHRVYAAQQRHLVEVPASEKDHIEAWLGKTTGVPFRVPDLEDDGYTFAGARLLVAAGKPTFQLIYQSAEGRVLAICGLAGGDPAAAGSFGTRQFDDIHMVNWKSDTAAFVLVADDATGLEPLARKVSDTI